MRNGLKRIMAILIATLILLGALPASALETESSNVVVPGIDLAGELDAADQDIAGNGTSTNAIGGESEITLTVDDVIEISSSIVDRPVSESSWVSEEHAERWTSGNETIAKVAGQADGESGDDQYRQTSATITAVSAGDTQINHHYWTADEFYGVYYNWQEQTETITVHVVERAAHTVEFSVGAEAEAAGVEAPASVSVIDGQTVPSLPTLEWRGESGEIVKIFAGWYSNEGLTTEFTENTPVTGDITLYARWVEEDTDGFYYVNFYSQDAQTVHLTMAVTEGRTVGEPDGPIVPGKVFVGWSMTLQGISPADALDAFDFSTPVSAVATDGTLNLYAWYADAIEVRFVANGGTAVPTQTIATGSTATEPTTTRTGYTFQGWSTDAETFEPFDFATSLVEDTTLYAFWEANMVRVTLVYMYENANDEGYSPAGYSETVYAPAGSYVSIEQNDSITDTRATHDVRYAVSDGGELSGYAKTSETGGSNATIRDVRDSYFQYHSATNNRLVMPNGSTVVLVYYNRARITLNFDYNQNGARGSIDYENLISAANRDKYQVSYTRSSDTHFTYSFTAKYGQDITAVWPQITWVKNSNGNTPSYEGNTFYAWLRPDRVPQSSNMYTLESSLFTGVHIENGVLVGNGSLPSQFIQVQKDWLIYARTTLPGETVDFTYGGNNYTIYKEASQLGYTGEGTFGYKDLEGCEPHTNQTLYTQYGDYMRIGNLTVPDSTLKEKFDGEFPNQIESGDNCQVLLYDRGSVTLTLYVNDDNPERRDNYLYGDWIYNDDGDLLKTVEAAMEKEGYVFAGWYTDPNFTAGTEYKLDENSRIYGNLNLFAKWEPDQFLAEYYLYVDDQTPYATQGFAEGGYIENKFVPPAVQDSFEGWYWYVNGELEPFDFTSAVGQAYVDETGVLKLYGVWEGDTGRVSYLPGIGGDNASQEVLDNRHFEINYASVQLPIYSKVWPDGTVPTDQDLEFVGWKAPNGRIYQPGRYVLVTRQLMQFEAQWSKDAVTLIYDANGGVGENVTETWARNSEVAIWDNMDASTPHFTKKGYELIGWDTDPNATEPTYKLGEGTITLNENSTTLYAIWKQVNVDITITKSVVSDLDADKTTPFTFTYTVNDEAQGEPISIVNGQSATITVPVGSKVVITETKDDNFSTQYAIDKDAPVDGNVATIEAVAPTGHTVDFTNTRKTGDLIVEKQVTGNMGDRQKDFAFSYSYTLDGQTYVTGNFTLSDDETFETLSNLPVGVVVTITESDYTGQDTGNYDDPEVTIGGSEVEATQSNGFSVAVTLAEGENKVVFTNNKEATPDTGIVTDSLPYIVILACVVAIGAVVIVRRRGRRDE